MLVRNFTSLGVVNLDLAAQEILDSLENCDSFYRRRTVTILRQRVVIGIRANDRDRTDLFTYRQCFVLVFEKHETLARRTESDLLVLQGINNRLCSVSVSDVGVIEDTHQEFHSQNIAHPVIQSLQGNSSFFNQLAQRQNEVLRFSEVSLHI